MNYREKQFELDPESGSVDIAMLQYMHPMISFIIMFTNGWCHEYNIKPVWTSWMRTAEQNEALGATDVHLYRAADLSLKEEHGWNIKKRAKYQREIVERFQGAGAVVRLKDGKMHKRVIVRHDIGHGDHFHLQVSPRSTMSDVK